MMDHRASVELTCEGRSRGDNVLHAHTVNAEAFQLEAVLPSALASIVCDEERALPGSPQRLNSVDFMWGRSVRVRKLASRKFTNKLLATLGFLQSVSGIRREGVGVIDEGWYHIQQRD